MYPPGPPRRGHLALFALTWVMFVVYGSLVPAQYHAVPLSVALEQFRHLPMYGSRTDWATNVVLFVPLTFLWMGALSGDRGRTAQIAATIALLPLSAALAGGIEFLQFWFPPRTPSLNDIIAETAGGV